MTPEAALEFLYPYLFASGDPRAAGADEVEMALLLAADYRPRCLPETRQNIAQAHYAAFILAMRRAQALGTSTFTPGGEVTAGPVVEFREGDLSLKYATNGGDGTTTTTRAETVEGPATPYAAWKAMADLCRFGAILTARMPSHG